MPYKDPEAERLNAIERKRRYRARKHAERYGEGAGPQGGKHGNHARGPKNGQWNDGMARHEDAIGPGLIISLVELAREGLDARERAISEHSEYFRGLNKTLDEMRTARDGER